MQLLSFPKPNREADELNALVGATIIGREGERWAAELDQIVGIANQVHDPFQWNEVSVSELLLWSLPRSGNFEEAAFRFIADALAEWMLALENVEDSVLEPSAAELAELARGLRDKAAIAMATRGKWGANKRMFPAVGLDLAGVRANMDAGYRALKRASRDFNNLPDRDRARILGPTIGRGREIIGRDYPAIEAAAPAATEAAVRQTTTFQRLTGLIDYVGEDGLKLTAKGNLKLVDGKALVGLLNTGDPIDPKYGDRVFKTTSTAQFGVLGGLVETAVDVGILRRSGGRLTLDSFAKWVDRRPLESMQDLLAAEVRRGRPNEPFPWLAEFSEFSATALLLDFYELRDPMSVADVAAAHGLRLRACFEIQAAGHFGYLGICSAANHQLTWALTSLVSAGVLELSRPDALDSVEGLWPVDLSALIDVSVTFTQLGLELVQPIACEHGSAPIYPSVVGVGPDQLLESAVDQPHDVAFDRVINWLMVASPEDVEAFGECLLKASELVRSVGMQALFEIGDTAAPAMEVVGADPELAYVALCWRSLGVTDEDDPFPAMGSSDSEYIDIVHAVFVILGTESVGQWAERAAGPGGLLARLEGLWRVDNARADEVLGAIATGTTGAASKAARKALFRRRSR